MNEKKIDKSIEKHKKNIEKLTKQQSGRFMNESKKQQLQDKIDNENYMISLYNDLKNGDESAADKLHQAFIDNSKWTRAANASESIGNKMQSAGKSMTKAGLHTTAAVWTPAIYLGYQAVKQSRKQPKNETPEQDLIELINEVEKAHKDGKINEQQKKEYVIDFVDNYYR